MNKNVLIWKTHGFDDGDLSVIDTVMGYYIRGVELGATLSKEQLRGIFDEAVFQIRELPKRDKAFQRKNLWVSPGRKWVIVDG